MIKHIHTASLLAFIFALAIVTPVSAAETGAGVELAKPTTHNVMTDMLVPPECLESGKTICAKLEGNSTRQLIYGAACYKLKNKTANTMFVPLRTNTEIEQFLLNVPANVVHREPCETN